MTKVQIATRYEILRGVSPTGRTPCTAQPSEKPIRIAFILNEKKFVETGGEIKHHDTLFLEDRIHDWDWRNGKLYYYGRALGLEETGDIVAIHEVQEREKDAPPPSKNLSRESLLASGFKIIRYPNQDGEFLAKTVLVDHLPHLIDHEIIFPGMLATVEVTSDDKVQMCISDSDYYEELCPMNSKQGQGLLKSVYAITETHSTPGSLPEVETTVPYERQ